MLVVGLTGGIASGKSTAARTLADLGAVVVDADALSREVLRPGTPGLAAVVDRFGPGVLEPDGSLARGALASRVFSDESARADLEAIVHPAVGAAFEQRVAEAPGDAVVVHDVPLLAENGLAPRYHLVLVTQSDPAERVRRAVTERGMTREAVLARIAAQASDSERRAIADVVLDTTAPLEVVRREIEVLWRDRLVPYEENVRNRRCAPRALAALVDPPRADPWDAQAARLLARVRLAGGELVHDAAHIGSTAVPGMPAKDVIDLQVGVASRADAEDLAPRLAAAGFPSVRHVDHDDARAPLAGYADAPTLGWAKLFCANADPGRAVNLHVRVTGSQGWLWALAFRDWLRSDLGAHARYLALKRETLEATRDQLTHQDPTGAYAVAKDSWWRTHAAPELANWVERTDWRPAPGT